ncbi:glycoside hydrolase family 28 protein [Candidatus Sumerlaeota bacterium]|nr:glycoside hydrolase family 28 protein [Candidatus Sumerlaeota bacterium]
MSDQNVSNSPHVFNVVDYGAVGDGQTENTEAIHRAIDACVQAGGGTVWVPAGRYVTGSVFLKTNVTFHIDSGATILGSEEPEDYPVVNARWEGIERKTYAPLFGGDGQENIAIVGRGTIDGRGQAWWERVRARTLEHPRPRLVSPIRCKNVLIEGVTLTNSPSWTLTPVYCDNVTIHRVIIRNPWDSPNTDGINPDSCSNVRISNCHIDVGDDCITLKSGTNEDGRRVGRPCEKIAITNCTMVHGHGGVVIGSEMSAGVRDVVISNCVFVDTDRGIRIKSRRRRGGFIEDVRVDNIVMRNVLCPIVMNAYYKCGSSPDDEFLHGKEPKPVEPDGTPIFRNFHLANMTARNVRAAAGFLYGLPELPIEGVTFSNIVISMSDDPDVEPDTPAMMYGIERTRGAGFFATNIKDVEFHNVHVTTESGPALTIENAEDIEIDGFRTHKTHADTPVVRMRNVRGALVRGCRSSAGTDRFLEISGGETRDVLVSGNNLGSTEEPVILGDDLSPGAVKQD